MKMESLVTLNSGRNGRDKIFRAAQYALKLVNAFQVNNRLRACSVVLMVLVQYVTYTVVHILVRPSRM